MLKKTMALGLGAALSAAALPALADTHITFVDDKGSVSTQMFIKNGKVRIEGQGGNSISLYDSASNTATVLLPGQKKYLRLDNQSTAQVGAEADAAQQKIQNAQAQAQTKLAQNQAEMDQASQQSETATANLTPEQKAMLQQMNQPHTGSNNPLPGAQDGGMRVVMKDLGTTETVAGHSCKDVQVLINDQPRATDCVVDSPTSLGIPAADLKTLQAMRVGMQKMMSRMGPMGQGMAAAIGNGFAIKTTRQSYRNLNMETETDTLKSISTSSVDAGLFSIPAGYSQTTLPEMMQGGHQ
jgi:hypothetical protein